MLNATTTKTGFLRALIWRPAAASATARAPQDARTAVATLVEDLRQQTFSGPTFDGEVNAYIKRINAFVAEWPALSHDLFDCILQQPALPSLARHLLGMPMARKPHQHLHSRGRNHEHLSAAWVKYCQTLPGRLPQVWREAKQRGIADAVAHYCWFVAGCKLVKEKLHQTPVDYPNMNADLGEALRVYTSWLSHSATPAAFFRILKQLLATDTFLQEPADIALYKLAMGKIAHVINPANLRSQEDIVLARALCLQLAGHAPAESAEFHLEDLRTLEEDTRLFFAQNASATAREVQFAQTDLDRRIAARQAATQPHPPQPFALLPAKRPMTVQMASRSGPSAVPQMLAAAEQVNFDDEADEVKEFASEAAPSVAASDVPQAWDWGFLADFVAALPPDITPPDGSEPKARKIRKLSDVKGCPDAVNDFAQALREQPPGWPQANAVMILQGPPGSGKTFLAECLADEYQTILFKYSLLDGGSTFYNGTLRDLRRFFKAASAFATAHNKVGLIFMDEVDSIAASRDTKMDSPERGRDCNGLLQLINSDLGTKNLAILCATNLYWRLDEAFTDRMIWQVEMSLLTAEERVALLVELTADRQIFNVEATALLPLVPRLENFNGRNMEALRTRACAKAVRRWHDSNKSNSAKVELSDIEAALKEHNNLAARRRDA